MKIKQILFGIAVVGACAFLFTAGQWIGLVSTGEAQCLPIKFVDCGVSPCDASSCGAGFVSAHFPTVSGVQSDSTPDHYIDLCMGV
jgi:hypothetical protein